MRPHTTLPAETVIVIVIAITITDKTKRKKERKEKTKNGASPPKIAATSDATATPRRR